MTESTIETAFDLYATTQNLRDRQRAFSELVSLKALPKRSDDLRFSEGVKAWQSALQATEVTDEDRLLAIAELVRTGQVVKSKAWSDRIAAMVAQALGHPLPPCNLLKDADERLNVARACASSPHVVWLKYYAAQAVAEEDAGEKARAEFLEVLFFQAGSLTEVFSLLAEAFASVRVETESPGDSMGKRLIRTLSALRPALLSSLLEAGEDAGRRLDECLRAAMRNAGKPRDEKTQLDLTREVVLTLHDLVRTRFSLATEAETFTTLKQCRSFFSSVSWPESVRDVMELLVQDVSEALLLLGRQDVPQQALLEQLELVCGLKERAKAVATQLADRHAELPERIRDWLRRGRLVTQQATSIVLQASLLEANDTAVGLALIEARKLATAQDTWQRIAGTIEIYEPTLMRAADAYAQQVRDALTAVQEVANRRSINLLGAEGEELEFMPKYFDPLRPLNGTCAIVRRPAIVRGSTTQGATEVVMKGLVE